MIEVSVPNMPHNVNDIVTRAGPALEHRAKHSKPRLRNALTALKDGGRRAIKRQHQDGLELEYLRQIHRAVHGMLSSKHEPVLLAGPRRVQAFYRKIDSGSYLYGEAVTANPDRLQNFELRDRARALLGEYFTERELAAQSQFLRLSVARPEKIVYGIKNVLKSVYQGRVQTLFVDRQAKQWGIIKRTLVELHRMRIGGDSNLVDVAASETLKRKGHVFTLESSDLPRDSKIAAILRY